MPTIKFNSIKGVEEYFKNTVVKILDKIAFQVKDDLYKLAKERLYDAWTPVMYKRTMELLDSISKTEVYRDGNKYCIKIYYDTDKILSYPSLSNLTGNKNEYGSTWGQHADFYGNDVAEYIPLWIEKGTSGSNNPYHRKGIKSIDDLKEWLDDNFTELFSKKLKEQGINNY